MTPQGIIALCAVFAFSPRVGVAQSVPQSSPPDTTRPRPEVFWLSLGLGPATNGFAAVARANLAVGDKLLTYRKTESGPFFSGSGIEDDAFLVGRRSRGARVFMTAAVGLAYANTFHQSDNGSGHQRTSSGSLALAYDFGVHANAFVPGLSAAVSGNIGSSKTIDSILTISLDLGWFP